jgi:tRNA (guanine37-N1)-methyltransferase
MRFDILTIFPQIIDSYAHESILGRGQKKKLIKITAHDLRRWAKDKHRSVDDTPYGGGPGMVMRADVIASAVTQLIGKSVNRKKTRVILFSAAGKPFTQRDATRYAKKYDRLIMICGRYEGVDERVAKFVADEEVSIGDYVLSGGELPALIVTEAVARLIPGVLGKGESEESQRFGIGVPQYTRPEGVIIGGKKRRVPKVLTSGNHKEIEAWRSQKRRG